jgi:hypothetical protein
MALGLGSFLRQYLKGCTIRYHNPLSPPLPEEDRVHPLSPLLYAYSPPFVHEPRMLLCISLHPTLIALCPQLPHTRLVLSHPYQSSLVTGFALTLTSASPVRPVPTSQRSCNYVDSRLPRRAPHGIFRTPSSSQFSRPCHRNTIIGFLSQAPRFFLVLGPDAFILAPPSRGPSCFFQHPTFFFFRGQCVRYHQSPYKLFAYIIMFLCNLLDPFSHSFYPSEPHASFFSRGHG